MPTCITVSMFTMVSLNPEDATLLKLFTNGDHSPQTTQEGCSSVDFIHGPKFNKPEGKYGGNAPSIPSSVPRGLSLKPKSPQPAPLHRSRSRESHAVRDVGKYSPTVLCHSLGPCPNSPLGYRNHTSDPFKPIKVTIMHFKPPKTGPPRFQTEHEKKIPFRLQTQLWDQPTPWHHKRSISLDIRDGKG